MITIADRLVEAMKKANISQADLHRKTGFTRAAISKWVNGHSEPKDILTLSRILDVTPEWLQTGKESRSRGEQYSPIDMNALISVATETYLPELVRLQELQEKGVLVDADIAMLRVIIDRYKDRK